MPRKTLAKHVAEGYDHPGGLVSGKYLQDKFTHIDCKSEDHWLLRRLVASVPKPSRNSKAQPYAAGMTKSFREVFCTP